MRHTIWCNCRQYDIFLIYQKCYFLVEYCQHSSISILYFIYLIDHKEWWNEQKQQYEIVFLHFVCTVHHIQNFACFWCSRVQTLEDLFCLHYITSKILCSWCRQYDGFQIYFYQECYLLVESCHYSIVLYILCTHISKLKINSAS